MSSEVGVIITNSYAPDLTLRGVRSLKKHYPEVPVLVVDDNMGSFSEVSKKLPPGVDLVWTWKRVGHGLALDRGLRLLDFPFVISMDHDTVIVEQGGIELLLEELDSQTFGVGTSFRNQNSDVLQLGPYVHPWFALWNREIIRGYQLSFAHLDICFEEECYRLPAAQFLCHRAQQLGFEPGFVERAELEKFVEHKRDAKRAKTFGGVPRLRVPRNGAYS